MARMISTPRSRKGWISWLILTAGAIVAVKAFWPAVDAKLDGAAAEVKKVVNGDKTTSA